MVKRALCVRINEFPNLPESNLSGGDELMSAYSCHGTQVDDRDGDEPDRLDE
jgi:hypothetical protein